MQVYELRLRDYLKAIVDHFYTLIKIKIDVLEIGQK